MHWKRYAAAILMSTALVGAAQKENIQNPSAGNEYLWSAAKEAIQEGKPGAKYIDGIAAMPATTEISPLRASIANALFYMDAKHGVFSKKHVFSIGDGAVFSEMKTFIDELRKTHKNIQEGEAAAAYICDTNLLDEKYMELVRNMPVSSHAGYLAYLASRYMPADASRDAVAQGVKKLFKSYNYDSNVRTVKTFDDIRQSINRGEIPVIISPRNMTVAGYFDGDRKYLIVHDPSKSLERTESGLSLLAEGDRKSNSESSKKMKEMLEEMTVKSDFIGSSDQLPPGAEFYVLNGGETAISIGIPKRNMEDFARLVDKMKSNPDLAAACITGHGLKF